MLYGVFQKVIKAVGEISWGKLLLESPDGVSECLNRFVPEKFEELFTKFAKTEKSKLSFDELLAMTEANRNAVDPFGW